MHFTVLVYYSLYSKTYIKRLPSFLRNEYDCYCVEDYMYSHYEPNFSISLVTIILLCL